MAATMAPATDARTAQPRQRGRAVLAVTRWLVTAHTVVLFAQPVFAGNYLTGDYDMLALHALGADLVTYTGAALVVACALLWRRAGTRWPFVTSLLLFLGASAQYFAGVSGELGVHVPLGVALLACASLMLVSLWRTTGGAR